MKEIREGIKQDIRKVLGELEFNRCEGCSHPYKSLTDSLEKLVSIETSQKIDAKERGFYKALLSDLEKEAIEVRNVANSTLSNRDYKEYRNWLESLRRIVYMHEKIEYIVKGLYKEQ